MTIRVMILEDEPTAASQIVEAVKRWDPAARVLSVAESVRAAIDALRSLPRPDVIFADIRLADGLSFRAFDEVSVRCPVVFATAYDARVIEEMERHAVDYILKPIEAPLIARTLDRYARLRAWTAG
ncbi:MAG: response regulator [Minicystis sp.]